LDLYQAKIVFLFELIEVGLSSERIMIVIGSARVACQLQIEWLGDNQLQENLRCLKSKKSKILTIKKSRLKMKRDLELTFSFFYF